MDSLTILDVSHGNCAVVRSGDQLVIIDCPRRGALLEHLQAIGIRDILALLISHGDADHMNGADALLVDPRFRVLHVYVNPDAKRDTRAWRMLKRALKVARKEKGTAVHSALNSVDPGFIDIEPMTVEVLAPMPEVAISGPGSQFEGERLSANSNSAVVRITAGGRGLVLLPGDLDEVGFHLLRDEVIDLSAGTLVFPHHGGASGANSEAFAVDLCTAVGPKHVVFSIGRLGSGTFPRQDIVSAIKEVSPDAHIACTKLAGACEGRNGGSEPGGPRTCAGTIHIDVESGEWLNPRVADHRQFVVLNVPSAMCMSRDQS